MFLDSGISIFIAFGTKIPLPCLQCPGWKEFAVFFRYQILSNLANVNTESGNVNVPLYAAVETWNPDIVRLLLEQKGIDVNVPQNTRMSWDDYERIGYGGGDYRRQVSQTALQRAEEVAGKMGRDSKSAQIAQLLCAKGAW
ncbi:MAG: hypothetical protein LBF34_01510 [Puniceicoccales bacterium]|jgi:hypothetical protein|nr:hypothetical protein [Puniceicoccales bacterium]